MGKILLGKGENILGLESSGLFRFQTLWENCHFEKNYIECVKSFFSV